MKELCSDYLNKEKFLAVDYPAVDCLTMFRDVFPEGSFERAGHPEDRKPNGFVTYIRQDDSSADNFRQRSRSTIVFDDLSEYEAAAGDEFCITNCVAYSGRNRTRENAYKLYGIVIDIDYVDCDNLVDLLFEMEGGIIPKCTYLVNSGTGVHAYYVFSDPIPIKKHFVEPINDLKRAVTDIVWNQYTSREKNKQYQSIFQGFRVPGSQSKLGKDYPVVAHKVGMKVDLEYLCGFVDDKVDLNDIDALHLTLEDWKELDPDWFERRIVRQEPRKYFLCNRGMYETWRDKYIRTGAFDGNRYHCICVLFANAVKCGIPLEEVMRDAEALQKKLNKLTVHENNQFTMQDVMDASLYYNEESYSMKAETIRAKTKIELPKGKRNGRSSWEHLQADTWDNGSRINVCKENRKLALKKAKEEGRLGRPKKNIIIMDWRISNPEKTMKDCQEETGISRNTIKKWWDFSVDHIDKEEVADRSKERRAAYEEMYNKIRRKKRKQKNNQE